MKLVKISVTTFLVASAVSVAIPTCQAQSTNVAVTQPQPEVNLEVFDTRTLQPWNMGHINQRAKDEVLDKIKNKASYIKDYNSRGQLYEDIGQALDQDFLPVFFFDAATHVVSLYDRQSIADAVSMLGVRNVTTLKIGETVLQAKKRSPESVYFFHPSTTDFMKRVSQKIFRHSTDLGAELLTHGYITVGGAKVSDPEKIDAAMIKQEQTHIQDELVRLNSSEFNEIVNDVNYTLRYACDSWVARNIGVSYFSEARRELRLKSGNLKLELNFGSLEHRIIIGQRIIRNVVTNADTLYKQWREFETKRKSGAAFNIGGERYPYYFWIRENEVVDITASGTMKMYDEVCSPVGVQAKTKPFWSMLVNDESIYGAFMGYLDGTLGTEDRKNQMTNWFVVGTAKQFTAPFSGWIGFGINSGTPAKSGVFKVKIRITDRK